MPWHRPDSTSGRLTDYVRAALEARVQPCVFVPCIGPNRSSSSSPTRILSRPRPAMSQPFIDGNAGRCGGRFATTRRCSRTCRRSTSALGGRSCSRAQGRKGHLGAGHPRLRRGARRHQLSGTRSPGFRTFPESALSSSSGGFASSCDHSLESGWAGAAARPQSKQEPTDSRRMPERDEFPARWAYRRAQS